MTDRKLALPRVIVSAMWTDSVHKMNPSGDSKAFGRTGTLVAVPELYPFGALPRSPQLHESDHFHFV